MFSSKIKELRIEKGLNQEDVAKGISVGKNTYLAYEKGTQSPKLETIEKIAKFYGVTVTEIISEENVSTSNKLKAKLAMIEELGEKEKESLMIMIEGLVMRSRNREIQQEFKHI